MKKTSLFTLLLIGFFFVLFVNKARSSAECTPGKDSKAKCGSFKQCVKVDDEYHCVCKPGYAPDGKFCKDVDECKDKKNRMRCKDIGATCKNTRGSYECKCPRGFEMHPSKQVCEDYDECEELTICHEQATCSNTKGSYKCQCKKGFAGDGVECVVDEAYKQQKNIQLIIMIGGAAGGGLLLIIALIAFCCCARKRKKEEDGEKVEKMESTLSQYGNDWESSDSEEDESD
ncbi:uromodulin-like [Oculina patagonica]